MRTPSPLALVIVAGALAVAGCGSSNSTGSTSTGGSTGAGTPASGSPAASAAAPGSTGTGTTTTAGGTNAASGATAADQRYIAKANQICKTFKDKLGNANIPESPPLVQKFIADIAALPPPADKRAGVAQWQAALKRKLAIYKKLPAAVDAADSATVQALGAEIKAIDTSSQTQALGLTDC